MSLDLEERKLLKLKSAALLKRFKDVVGSSTKSTDRAYLVRRILQASHAKASLAEATRARNIAGPGRRGSEKRDPRLPAVGTVLEREHDGEVLSVTVLADGFQFRGQKLGSLSAVAKKATGTVWNGLLFWGLVKRRKRAAR